MEEGLKVDEAKEKKKKADQERMAKARAARQAKPVVEKVISEKELDAEDIATNTLKVSNSDIKWFGEVDYNDKGKLAADYPAYYFMNNVHELEEEIRTFEEDINDGVYTGPKVREAKEKLRTMKERHESIVNSKPNLSGVQKDKVSKSLDELCDSIKASHFTYDERWKQECDPHEELRRQKNPCIDIRDSVVGSFAKEKGINVKNGKISRDDAMVMAKIMANVLDKQLNINYKR
jgi:hypothetical protein